MTKYKKEELYVLRSFKIKYCEHFDFFLIEICTYFAISPSILKVLKWLNTFCKSQDEAFLILDV